MDGKSGFNTLLDVAIHPDRKSTRLNSSHLVISYAVFCLKKKNSEPGRISGSGSDCPPLLPTTSPAKPRSCRHPSSYPGSRAVLRSPELFRLGLAHLALRV